MFDQLESVEEERRQGVTMDERGGGLMLVSPRPLDRIGLDGLPAIVTQGGEQVRWRFLEFFTANIRNKNTRMAYVRATGPFLAWSEQRGIGDLRAITSIVVAACIEQHPGVPPTVKRHLAAIRMLFDWLVTGQIMPMNPASAIRGPKYVVKRGKTPVLSAEEGPDAPSVERHQDHRRPAGSGPHRGHGAYPCPRQCGDRHAGAGLLREGQALVVSPA
jgi:hypothetical protein